jgi:hypothetical protein
MPKPDAVPLFVDPDNVPIRVVNQFSLHGVSGSQLDVTFSTLRITPYSDGNSRRDMVVAARLRFDLEMAKIIRDLLDQHIALATAKASRAN